MHVPVKTSSLDHKSSFLYVTTIETSLQIVYLHRLTTRSLSCRGSIICSAEVDSSNCINLSSRPKKLNKLLMSNAISNMRQFHSCKGILERHNCNVIQLIRMQYLLSVIICKVKICLMHSYNMVECLTTLLFVISINLHFYFALITFYLLVSNI